MDTPLYTCRDCITYPQQTNLHLFQIVSSQGWGFWFISMQVFIILRCIHRRYSPPSSSPRLSLCGEFIFLVSLCTGFCLTLYVLAIKFYWQANKKLMAQLVHNKCSRYIRITTNALQTYLLHNSPNATLTLVQQTSISLFQFISFFLNSSPLILRTSLFSGTNQLNP